MDDTIYPGNPVGGVDYPRTMQQLVSRTLGGNQKGNNESEVDTPFFGI